MNCIIPHAIQTTPNKVVNFVWYSIILIGTIHFDFEAFLYALSRSYYIYISKDKLTLNYTIQISKCNY